MASLRTVGCAICGEERSGNQTRFLIAENQWEDKLTVLRWNEHMASRRGIQTACSDNHVEELVVHWMTTGSLDYPFARTALGAGRRRQVAWPGRQIDLSGGQPIGELSVHRESMERVLAEHPQSLQVVLDALLDALRRETASDVEPLAGQREETELCAVSLEPQG